MALFGKKPKEAPPELKKVELSELDIAEDTPEEIEEYEDEEVYDEEPAPVQKVPNYKSAVKRPISRLEPQPRLSEEDVIDFMRKTTEYLEQYRDYIRNQEERIKNIEAFIFRHRNA